jgi:hypothetical protein
MILLFMIHGTEMLLRRILVILIGHRPIIKTEL